MPTNISAHLMISDRQLIELYRTIIASGRVKNLKALERRKSVLLKRISEDRHA